MIKIRDISKYNEPIAKLESMSLDQWQSGFMLKYIFLHDVN